MEHTGAPPRLRHQSRRGHLPRPG